jgi:hypothetical protein
MDRLFDEEKRAPMTGQRKVFDFQMLNLGVVDLSAGASAPAWIDPGEEPGDEYEPEGEGDYTPLAFGDPDPRCSDWTAHCQKLAACGYYGPEWSDVQCVKQLFAFTKSSPGQRFLRDIAGCNLQGSCGEYLGCRQGIWNEQFVDGFGCGNSYGPEANDFVLLVERGGQLYKEQPGYTLQNGEKLAIFVDYKDVEGNFSGGWLHIEGAGNTISLPVGYSLGFSAFKDKAMVGFTVQTPLPAGEYNLVLRMEDGGCLVQGVPFRVNFKSAGVGVGDNAPIEGRVPFEMFEIYSLAIDKYNMGEGFVDLAAFNTYTENQFAYELTPFDVGIIQGYVWSMSGVDNFKLMTLDDLNRSIFTTTHDINGTKFDETDDTQSYAFFIDQPMTPGLFTFYGDAGWNLYPIGPYGANDDQPFEWAAFDTTRVKVPFSPIYSVSDQYVGCNDTCDYWIRLVYSQPDGLTVPGYTADKMDQAIADCQANSDDEFWRGLLSCYRKAAGSLDACVPLDVCVGSLPKPLNRGKRICDRAENIPLHVAVTIPPEFLASTTYGPVIQNATGNLKIGVFSALTGAGCQMVPGAFETFDINKAQGRYDLSLPYMPLVPQTFMQISSAEGSVQSQLYVGLCDVTADPAGLTGDTVGAHYSLPSAIYEDDEWFYLVIYTYNWSDPAQEGWALGVVSANTIYDFVDPYKAMVDVVFGSLQGVGEDDLKP